MNKTKIEWCDYTWNPVVGCKNACWYCYAKKMNDRFGWIKDFTKPKFYPERLKEPYKLKKPSKIFVCSMADLFGKWVSNEWISKIIDVARDNPQHTFQFLTKSSGRYLGFVFPKNCWLGITEDYVNQARLEFLKHTENYKFISFEPLLGDMSMLDLSGIDLCIIGAMTGKGATPPKKEWIDSIRHENIFYKDNIKKFL